MAERMATWVLWGVISWQRRFEEYAAAQRSARWDLGIEGRTNRDNCDVRVGVMGFGEPPQLWAAQLLVCSGPETAAAPQLPSLLRMPACCQGGRSQPPRPGPCIAGLMGRTTAEALQQLGYQVSAWSRSPKQHQVCTLACSHARG